MFNLTRQEQQVIIFFLAVSLLGTAIDFCRKKFSSPAPIANFIQNIGKIDLNRADKELLTTLAGIGEKLAVRIIEYRCQEGSFQSVDQLKEIKGISENKFEKIKNQFFVSG